MKPAANVHVDQVRDVHMFSSILTIDRVTMDFDGKYKVILKNELGEAVSSTQVNVKRCALTSVENDFYDSDFFLASMAVQLQAPPKKTSTVEPAQPSLSE